jgi:nicotinamidase-related amidase
MTIPLHGGDGTALLIIDLQVGMFNGERIAPIHMGETLLADVGKLLAAARRSGTLVIYVRHGGPRGSLLEPGTGNWLIHPSIAPLEREVIVDKRTPDSFHETTLMSELAAAGVKRLIVTGAQSEVCVDTTCRRAFTLGFDSVLVSDGHSTWDNDSLTADQIIRHTNQTLTGWFLRTMTVAEAERWIGGA